MKIIVFSYELKVGGTQVNAIELSAALRDTHGHEVILFASPGPLSELAIEMGLRYVPAPTTTKSPSLETMRALHSLILQERPDVVHAWEWTQCVDAFFAGHVLHRIPLVVTDMLSDGGIERRLPKSVLTTFGTPEFLDHARAAGRRHIALLVPPVDIRRNAPNSVDPMSFKAHHCIADDDITLVTVSRLVSKLKGESLRRTISAVRTLAHSLPLRFILIGDGNLRTELEDLAQQANAELGREVVILPGEMLDPRPAYAAADIIIGMGGSALRGMAFGKPVIVVGRNGFASAVSPVTEKYFYYSGIYGSGDGTQDHLLESICRLATSQLERKELGVFCRQFVEKHFSMEVVSSQLNVMLRTAKIRPIQRSTALIDGFRSVAISTLGASVPHWIRQMVRSYESRKLHISLKHAEGSH
jgi:glycosyltransferase involved in cell wall biosynthesis